MTSAPLMHEALVRRVLAPLDRLATMAGNREGAEPAVNVDDAGIGAFSGTLGSLDAYAASAELDLAARTLLARVAQDRGQLMRSFASRIVELETREAYRQRTGRGPAVTGPDAELTA